MTIQEVEKYKLPVRVLHWVHTGAFIVLFLTGLVLFLPGLGFLSQNIWVRLIHRAVGIIFIAGPALFLVLYPRDALRGLKMALTWGAPDLAWLKAAPHYYLRAHEKDMPPQGFLNSGQKLWWLLILVLGLVLAVSGLIMWFSVTTAPSALLKWMVTAHDIIFIIAGALLLLHIYLAVFQASPNEAWKAMTGGKISADYARTHHAKWFDEITAGRK